ncbi:hypothetical protein ACHWQZ_G008408 [Mnemiopsis leidyi]
MGSYMTHSIGKHGKVLSLNERGQRKLWLHLRDGLNRSLGLNHPKRNETNATARRSQSDHEFTIINIYDSPENSSFKAKLNAGGNNERPPSTLDQLLEFLASKDNLGDIMVLGDLNARIGLSSPTFEDEDTETQPEFAGQPKSHPVTSDRASKDTVLNSRGKLLLDFLACTRLTVLNGCTLGDVLGEVTSVNYNGCSVVDYVAVNPNLRRRVVSFKVLDLTKYSDHKPCLCKIRAKSISLDAEELIDQLEDAPRKYKWDNENDRLHYNFLAIQNLQYYDSKIKEISQKQCHTSGEVIELNESLVQIYQEMADRLTGRASATSDKKTSFPACRSSARKRRPRMKPKSAWFDIDCIKGKRELNRTAKRYGADPTNDLLRALYYDQRKSYRRLIKNLCQEAGSASLSPKQIRGVARSVFQGCWNRERKQNRKLCFYNSIKDKLEIENYLQDVNLKPQQLKRIAQMRTSSHRLNIETGRHGIVKRNTVLNRVCHHCSDLTYLEYLAELPFFDPICEDEIHVLKSCPLYEDLRTNAHPAVKEHLQTDLKELFTDKELLPRFGGLISKIFDRRFAPCPGK